MKSKKSTSSARLKTPEAEKKSIGEVAREVLTAARDIGIDAGVRVDSYTLAILGSTRARGGGSFYCQTYDIKRRPIARGTSEWEEEKKAAETLVFVLNSSMKLANFAVAVSTATEVGISFAKGLVSGIFGLKNKKPLLEKSSRAPSRRRDHQGVNWFRRGDEVGEST